MSARVEVGDIWAGSVSPATGVPTHVFVHRVCGNGLGCPDSWRGSHAHVTTVTRVPQTSLLQHKRLRTVDIRRFREQPTKGDYHLVSRGETRQVW